MAKGLVGRIQYAVHALLEPFVPKSTSSKVDSVVTDEYSRLLAQFGLDDSASEAEIKKAYRNKMKELHPDTREPDNEGTEDVLMQLKKTHDRILEMKKARFS